MCYERWCNARASSPSLRRAKILLGRALSLTHSMLRLRPAIRAFATKKLNLNADLGEGFGPWRLTDDAALMELVTSANVACGGHAGDAATMARACALAADRGVSIGAHPGYDDKPGFGRRVIPLSMDEVEELVVCQVGALRSKAASLKCRSCIDK